MVNVYLLCASFLNGMLCMYMNMTFDPCRLVTRLTILPGTLAVPVASPSLTISILGTSPLLVSFAPVDWVNVSTATDLTLPINCRPSPLETGVPFMNKVPGSAFPVLGTVAEMGSFSETVDIEL